MAETLLTGEFWLPPGFLTDDGHLSDPKPIPKLNCPSDFPANSRSNGSSLSSPAFSSPVESTLGSTETESDEEDDSVAGLTRHFTQFSLHGNQNRVTDGSRDLLYGEMAGHVGMMKMNGCDEEVGNVRGHVGPPVGPTAKLHSSPLGKILSGSFYVNQFPINHVEVEAVNPNYCPILGRPFVSDLVRRQIQLQHIISQNGSKVLGRNQYKENAEYVHSSLGLPQFSGPYPLIHHQNNQMSPGDSLAIFARKQACAGTGVFIPRPSNKSASGCSTVQRPPRFYQVMNKNTTHTTAQVLTASDHDILIDRLNTIPIQKIPGSQLHGPSKNEQGLPQEWSY